MSATVSVIDAGLAAETPVAGSGLLRRALRQGRTRIGLLLVGVVLAVAFIGPLFAAHQPADIVGVPFGATSSSAPLGTDYLGHDVLSLTLHGGISVVWMSAFAAVLGVGVGAAFGMLAGYSRNWLDTLIMRVMDIVLAFPAIVLVLLFVSMIGPKEWLIATIVGAAWVPQTARVIRGATLEVVTREYIEAAEAIGVSRRRILAREVLPNVTTPLMVEFGLRLTWSIGAIAAISFLGQGVQPPAADWGLMINQNRNGLTQQPWAVLAPVICIAVFAFGTNLVTEGFARTVAGVGAERKGKK